MKKLQTLTVSITPNEILFPSSEIIIQSREPLDAKTAQAGIVVRGVRGRVQLARGGRSASWSPNETLKPGHHTLFVRGLQTKRLRGLADDLTIPFFVADSPAKVPANVRVENITRVRIGNLASERLSAETRPKGKFIDTLKATNRKTGAPIALAFNESGRPVDAERAFKQLEQRRFKKFGKLHETLFVHLQSSKRGRVPVAIWLKFDNTFRPNEKKTKGVAPRPIGRALEMRKAITTDARRFANVLKQEHRARVARADAFAPVVYTELTAAQIESVAKRRDVVGIFLHETEGIDDLADSIAIANSGDVHNLGFKASGVKVAIWENAPDDTTNLSLTARYKTSGFDTSQHARHTHGIMKNIEKDKPHGHAPMCALHSANSKDLDALRWAAKDKGCTVISQSFHRDSEPGSANLSYDDVYKDWLVLQWPYPTICQAAGNFWDGDPDNIQPPSDEFVNHKGFNSLTVGNHDDTATAMAGDSVFRNPSTTHADREVPEIAANGTAVTTVGLTMSGTSMASPAAAGCAALIQSVDETLKSWPEGCRAILLAGAKRNVAGNTWWQDVMAKRMQPMAAARSMRWKESKSRSNDARAMPARQGKVGMSGRCAPPISIAIGSRPFPISSKRVRQSFRPCT
jgi:hypothetical protein